uniref:Ubiquitin associated protein 2 like n=1 Tax=Molossus molossus TaxID=27622 RepID=A0A7J8CVA9_MOLMO|nr:ubiquitin associated protein 2 like [Molossus molossus]
MHRPPLSNSQVDMGLMDTTLEENIHPLTSISGRQRANLAQGWGLCFVCVYKFALKSCFRNQTTEESLLS